MGFVVFRVRSTLTLYTLFNKVHRMRVKMCTKPSYKLILVLASTLKTPLRRGNLTVNTVEHV